MAFFVCEKVTLCRDPAFAVELLVLSLGLERRRGQPRAESEQYHKTFHVETVPRPGGVIHGAILRRPCPYKIPHSRRLTGYPNTVFILPNLPIRVIDHHRRFLAGKMRKKEGLLHAIQTAPFV